MINVTKMQGGGTLAHEWFHALDNLVAEAEGNKAGAETWVTENPDALQPGPLRDAVVNLRRAMFDGEHRTSAAETYTPRDVKLAKLNVDARYPNVIAKLIKAAPDVSAAVQAVDAHFTPPEGKEQSRKSKQLQKDWRRLAVAWHGASPDGGTVDVTAGPSMSSFALEAARLDEHGATYWSTGKEMAARAFQSYVEDRLNGQGRRNDYLSCMADNRYHDQGKPYPEGDERLRINAAFEALFHVLRERNTLQKALAM